MWCPLRFFLSFVLTTTNTVTQYNILLTWQEEKTKNPRKTKFSAADMPSRFWGGGPSEKKKKNLKNWWEDGWREGAGRGRKRSLFEGLVDRGVRIQAGGIGVHELGGVVGGHRGHAAGVGCVGDAGHDGHHLGYLLLQVFYFLVFLQDLTCKQTEKQAGQIISAHLPLGKSFIL